MSEPKDKAEQHVPPIPDEELAAMLERAEKATPGPWDFDPGKTHWLGQDDREFIISARTDLPRVVWRLRQVERHRIASLTEYANALKDISKQASDGVSPDWIQEQLDDLATSMEQQCSPTSSQRAS